MFARITPLMTLTLVLVLPFGAQAGEGIPLNHMQILGSHNSYRPVPAPDQMARYAASGEDHSGSVYGHPDLNTQLDIGIRQFEFDPFADGPGGLYAAPYAGTPDEAVMRIPGPKVLHVPGEDYHSHCLTLERCFRTLATWSDAHPDHDPIVILVNTGERENDRYGTTGLDGLDTLARRVFGDRRLITPDEVRGGSATLRAGVMAGRWPHFAAARGRFLLVLDSSPELADLYRQGHPSLSGRAMFAFYDEAAPEAAVFNIQDPLAEGARICRLVQSGFLVRTRADADTREARAHDLSRLEAAVASGAQIISSDYYPGAPDPLGLKFVVRLKEGFRRSIGRCRPA